MVVESCVLSLVVVCWCGAGTDAQEAPKEEVDDGSLTVMVGSDPITIQHPNKPNEDGAEAVKR